MFKSILYLLNTPAHYLYNTKQYDSPSEQFCFLLLSHLFFRKNLHQMTISNPVRSWLSFGFLIPAVFVTIFVLYHLLSSRNLRKSLNNHVIILLLICGLVEMITDLSWQIHYYRTSTVLISQPAFCYIWVYLGSTLYISVYTLMAWASFERHILIFYPQIKTFVVSLFASCFMHLPSSLILCSIILFLTLFIQDQL